jgi:F0F1-type ATP synthase membrane subunit a
LLPLVVVLFELFVSFLQAFVFTMLVLVYFKIAQAH